MPMPEIPNDWLYPASLQAAADVQRQLAERVIQKDALPESIRLIGGTDASNTLARPDIMHAVVVSLDAHTLQLVDEAGALQQAAFPYVSGFLAFREVPTLIEAYGKLRHKPDLMLVDGHGISHPRGLGIASHLGVLLDCPTIGVAKTILVGKPDDELGPDPGDRVPLVWKGRTIGMVLRTRAKCNPVYVAVGHRVGLDTAVDWVLRCSTGFKLPEPTRQAHRMANHYRVSAAEGVC